MQPSFHRGDCQPEHFCGLGCGVPLHVTQQEDRAVEIPELADGLVDPGPQRRERKSVVSVGCRRERGSQVLPETIGSRAVASFGADCSSVVGACNRIRPRREGRRTSEGSYLSEERCEGLLSDIVCARHVAAEASAKSQDACVVTRHQLVSCEPVAESSALGEELVRKTVHVDVISNSCAKRYPSPSRSHRN